MQDHASNIDIFVNNAGAALGADYVVNAKNATGTNARVECSSSV